MLHPLRAGRRAQQSGRKGKSTHRGMVGGKLCLLLNHVGVVVAWDWAGANAPESAFPPLIEEFAGQMMVLSADGCPAKEGDPRNRKLCHRGTWNTRLRVETVRSLLTGGCPLKQVRHRQWAYLPARLAFTLAAFTVLLQWHGLKPDAQGLIRLSLAEFSL